MLVRAIQWSLLALCIAGAIALGAAAYAFISVGQAVAALPGAIHQEGEATRAMLTTSINVLTLQASDQVAAAVGDANTQLTGIRRDANRQTAAALELVDKHLGELTFIVNQRTGELAEGVKPILGQTTSSLGELDRTLRDLHPQLLGLVAASKVTAGQAALTLRDIQQAVPDTLNQLHAIELNVASTTEASAEAARQTAASANQSKQMFENGTIVLHNLAVDTHPLPFWLRLPLQIGSLLAPIAGGVASTLAATGGL